MLLVPRGYPVDAYAEPTLRGSGASQACVAQDIS